MAGRGLDVHQSVFGGLGSKKKTKKKHKHRRSQSPQSIDRRTEKPSTQEKDESSHVQGELRFVLPSKGSGKHVPFLFPGQVKQSIVDQSTGEDERKPLKEKDESGVDESIDDILFAGKKKSASRTADDVTSQNGKKKSSRQDEKAEGSEPRDKKDPIESTDNPKKKSKKEPPTPTPESPRKINARSVQDAVLDKIGRRPRANSTDRELNLPSHGLCDERIILESHKWDMLRLHNNNHQAVRNPPPPRGMNNLGNTCFLNATLQCLLYMPSFCQSITSLPASCYESNGSGKHMRGQRITMILRNLSRMAHGIIATEKNEPPDTRAIAPKSIVKAITSFKSGGHRFRPGRQEDAHELLVHLLDAMHEGELYAAGIDPHSSGWRDRLPIARLDETTFVHRIFGGYFRSQLRCNQCGYKSNTYDPFLDLALEVSKKHIHSLETAFKEFTRMEKLDSENRWKCSGCKKRVCPTKHLSVFRPPLSLCVHLKRFDYIGAGFGRGGWGGGYGHRHGKGLGMMGGGGSKITKPIQFPAQMKLPLSDDRVCEYVLTGIIVHVGNSATSGHYTAFVKKPGESKGWYHMDDSFVEAVSEKTVLKERDAYVLFYSRKEVKLEFPQPPREPVPKNGIKQGATKTKAEDNLGHDSASKNANGADTHVQSREKDKASAKKQKVHNPDPPTSIQSSKSLRKEQHTTAKTSQLESSTSVDSGSSPSTPKSLPSISPRSDSSAIKHAHEGSSKASSSSSDSSDSDSSDSASEKNKNLGNIKRSLEFAAQGQTPPSSSKPKPISTPAKKMQGNNVEVVLSRNKKRAWKPQDAAKVNSSEGNALLGNIAVGGWNDDDTVKVSTNGKTDGREKSSLRDMATKAMESADRSRKRVMHLDRWDAAIDEGKRKKVKTKNPDAEHDMKTTSDSFHRIQRNMQRMSKGKAKGFRPTKDPPRHSSFNKMKRKSLQKRKSI